MVAQHRKPYAFNEEYVIDYGAVECASENQFVY